MATPIVTKNLGINTELELEQVLKVWSVDIDAETEIIKVKYKIYTLSPTGIEVAVTPMLEYGRYNHVNNMAFDTWRNSPIGQGITHAINGTLQSYPNLEQINPENTPQ